MITSIFFKDRYANTDKMEGTPIKMLNILLMIQQIEGVLELKKEKPEAVFVFWGSLSWLRISHAANSAAKRKSLHTWPVLDASSSREINR